MLQSSRSQILCHWTGKDIDAKLREGSVTERKVRQAYVKRFISTLATGLWMTKGEEIIGGYPFELMLFPLRVCFSEILLSRSIEHAQRYGRLGFGFTRQFVASVGGSPVIYVGSSRGDPVLKVVAALSARIRNISTELLLDKKNPEYISGRKEMMFDLIDAGNLINRLGAFLKNMSHDNREDFDFLDEAEWRVVCYEDDVASQVRPGTVIAFRGRSRLDENWDSADQILRNPKPPPKFFLSFHPDDLTLVVLPDDETRSLVWSNKAFQDWLQQRSRPLQLLTSQECVRF